MANENEKPGQQGGTNTHGQQNQQSSQDGKQHGQENKNPEQKQQGDKN